MSSKLKNHPKKYMFLIMLLSLCFFYIQLKIKYPKHDIITHANLNDECILNADFHESGGEELAFILFNQELVVPIDFARLLVNNIPTDIVYPDPQAFEDIVYHSLSYTSKYDKPYIINGTINLDETVSPVASTMKSGYCNPCQRVINKLCKDNDILLMDLETGLVYQICDANWNFSIRQYNIQTYKKSDKTVGFILEDNSYKQALENKASV